MGQGKFGILTQKVKYKLWWDFLRVAMDDKDSEVDWAVYQRYGWGEIKDYRSFTAWWSARGRFLQIPVVRSVMEIPTPRPPHTVYLEVPLNRAPSRLTKRVRHILAAEFENAFPNLSVRQRKTFQGASLFTDARRISPDYYRFLLAFYYAVLKAHPNAKGKALERAIGEVHANWKKGQKTRWTQELSTAFVPRPFVESDLLSGLSDRDRIHRNIYRAKMKLEAIRRAVCRGNFP